MSSYFRTIVKIAFWSFLVFPLSFAPCQGVKKAAVFVTVDPPEATVHVGQTQKFTAVVKGKNSVGVRWGVDEKDGGRISEDGIYTAPGEAGIYHVVASSKDNPGARSIAKVTVVLDSDTD